MATWNITVPAGSGVGTGGSGSSGITPPGDFDGATITDVSVSGSPTITSDGATNDTLGIRWRIQTTAPAAVWGDYGSDAASACSASLGDSATSATITDGSAPSPAPSTAVAADWDQIAYNANYANNGMPDGETCSWSEFTIVVTYTPAAGGAVNERTLSDSVSPVDSISPLTRLVNRLVGDSIILTDTPAFRIREKTAESTVDLSDEVHSLLRLRQRVLTELLDVTDSVIESYISGGGPVINTKTLTDAIDAADSLIGLRLRQRILDDSVDVENPTDVVRVRETIETDLIEVTDAIAPLRLRNRQLESLLDSVADSVIESYVPGAGVNIVTLTDAITVLSDTVDIVQRFRSRLATSTVEVTDDQIIERVRVRLLQDVVDTLTDGINRNRHRNKLLTETVQVTDSVEALQRFRNRTLSDSVELTDATLALRLRWRVLTDEADPVDSVIEQYIGGGITVVTRLLSDTLEPSDGAIPLRLRNRILSETAELTDGSIVQRVRNRLGSDNITVSDFISDFAVRNVRLGDSVELTDDGELLFRLRNRTAGDSLDIADSLLPLRLWTRVLDDSFEPVDSLSKLYIPFEAVSVRIRLSDDNLWIVVDVDESGEPELGSVLANFIVPGDDT